MGDFNRPNIKEFFLSFGFITQMSKNVEDLKTQFIDKSRNKVYNIFNLNKKHKKRYTTF